MAHLLLPPADTPRSIADSSAGATDGSTPMRFVVDSGWRPIVTAYVDGIEVDMLVHANAGFLAMLTHDALYRVTGRRVSKDSEFGLGHDLRPSSAGRGATELESLTVAGHAMRGVRLEVFDLPTTNWEGMLGVDWLAASGAVVDFGAARLAVPRAAAERPEGSASERRLELDRDPTTGRWTCSLSAGSDRAPAGRFVVSTVAETTLDVEYARSLDIPLGEPVGEEHGPTGAVVPVYRLDAPIALSLDKEPIAAVRASIYDIYAYGGNPRPPEDSCIAGYLGADVLLDQRAVIDFGEN